MTRLPPEELIRIRRDFHANPELSHQEVRTARIVAERLQEFGLEPKTGIAGHGVIADIVGALDGPTLLYRADMDALPILEVAGREYGSQNSGVMHACGHDVHTTIGLGVASALVARREELHGRVRMLFQPAEEAAPPPGQAIGAEKMVEEGVLDEVQAAFALHVMPLLDVGVVGTTGGAVWAASDLFDIWIDGKMAHGAYPHEGRDTILAAAAVIQAIQQIPSRIVDARDACVVSVGRVEAGTAYNIIPAESHVQGLVRTLDPKVRDKALARLEEIATHTAAAHGCTARVQTVRGTYATINDAHLEAALAERIETSGAGVRVERYKPQMGAEDFAAFSRRVPGCYLFLGVRNEARGIVHMIHTPHFDVDERCLEHGVAAMSEAMLSLAADWSEVAGGLGDGSDSTP